MHRFAFAALTFATMMAAARAAAPAYDAVGIQDARIATVAYRLAVAGQPLCPRPVPQTGLILHYLADYDADDQPAAVRAWGLDRGPGILAVVANSPAAAAGVHAGDVLLGINDRAAPAGPRVGPRVGRSDPAGPMVEAAGIHAVRLRVMRGDQLLDVVLRPVPGCPLRARLAMNGQVNAFADGWSVIVTSALLARLRSDDELAFVIAHELGHIVAGPARGKADELAADAFAGRAMRLAGFDLAAMPALVRRVGNGPLHIALLSDHPGAGERIRAWRALAGDAGR